MKRIACGLLLAALLAEVAWADSGIPTPTAKDLAKAVEKANYVETDVSGVKLSGYVDVGYVYNFGSGARTEGYEPDGRAKGDFNLNAVKLTLEKALTDANKWQVGFRTDVMIGEDAQGFTGKEDGAGTLYLQQAYVVFRMPYGNGIDVQIGQMNSLLGYEADERPDNINITQGLNTALDPGPSPGVQISYPLTPDLLIFAAVNNGNGLSENTGLDTDNDGYAFVGALRWFNPQHNFESQLAAQYAPWGDPGVTESGDNVGTVGVSWINKWSPAAFNNKLELAINSSFWNVTGVELGTHETATFITTALYAKYQFTDLFSLAGRAEYAHTDNAALVYDNGLQSDDLYSFTLTAGFNLAEDLLLRAEYRVDLGNNVTNNDGNLANVVAFEAVYTF